MIATFTCLFAVWAVTNGVITSSVSVPQFTQIPVSLAPPKEYKGAFGQICLIPEADAPCSSEPPKFAGHAFETYPGFTKCDGVSSCCGCALISCGNSWFGCNTFSVGDFGAFGVRNINILGRPEGGANIHCFGIEACGQSVIGASNIVNIVGSATGSLRNSTVTVTKPVDGFDLDCIGGGSCESARIEIKIEGPPEGLKCNPDYAAPIVQLNSISCYGRGSCKDAHITINNMGCGRVEIQRIGCYDETACVGATFSFLGDVVVDSCHLIGQMDGIPSGLSGVCGLGVGPYRIGEYIHVTYPTQTPSVNVQSPSVVINAALGPSYPGGKPGGNGDYGVFA